MASGDVVGIISQIIPPQSSFATPDFVVGGSTPVEEFPVYDFPADSSVYLDFICTLQGYGGGGLTITPPWSASATAGGSNQVRWEAAIRRIADDAEDVNTAHTYDFNGASDSPPSAIGEISYPTITFTDGVDMDSLADGEAFVLRVYRDHDHADDAMSGDAELWAYNLVIAET